MPRRFAPAIRPLPFALAAAAALAGVALLVWDGGPPLFPPRAHDVLGALPLALIAAAYMAHEACRRPSRYELVRATLLAGAFLFWAANQYWPDIPEATLFNDLAVVLFVLDVLLTMIRPPDISTRSGQP